MPLVFDEVARWDATPARKNEGRFDFLNRSASPYFGRVRDLIEDWFANFPPAHQAALRGDLRASDDQSASAFWELYLHESYRRSGYAIEIHPPVAGRGTHPDFLMSKEGERFYVEAVSVGRRPAEVAADRRLDQIHQVLADLRVANFSLDLSTYSVGAAPLATKPLRRELRTWLSGLDPDRADEAAELAPDVGFDRYPKFTWESGGWSLLFRAVPRGRSTRGSPLPALGMWGPGEPVAVDNESGILRVLASKREKCGDLVAPLVVAVQSNTEYPTYDYQFDNALYGIGSSPHERRADDLSHLLQGGFWISKSGWRNAHVPQVVSVGGLSPWSVTRVQPCCWSTVQPSIELPVQPEWLAPMILGNPSLPGPATPMASHFGLDGGWPGMDVPDFDLTD